MLDDRGPLADPEFDAVIGGTLAAHSVINTYALALPKPPYRPKVK